MIITAIVLWAVLGATVLFWVYASLIEPRRLHVRHIEIPLPNLPPELAGLRIAHLSDLHCANQPGAAQVPSQAAAETLRAAPDLVLITGDLSSGSGNMAYTADQISGLRAQYGVYAVLGNHDWDSTLGNYLFGSPEPPVTLARWEETLSSTQVELLENASRTLVIRGQTVTLVGIGDPSCGRDDLPAALANAGPADLKILLAHSPDAIDLPGADWADLLLAGHTHGGQCQLPGWGSVWAPVWQLRQRSDGLFRFDETVVHVSRGICAGMDARFFCPPEVCIITLVRGPIQQMSATPRFVDEAECSGAPS